MPLTNQGSLWPFLILCSFRLFLEGKTGKEIPESWRLQFLEKFSGSNFALPDAEGNTSRLLNRGGMADLALLRTLLAIHQKSQEPCVWGSDGIFCFISIYKFGSIKNPFTMITSLSELYFRFRKFILLVQMKKVISKLMDLKQRVERAWSRSINQSLFFSFLMYIK